MTDSAKFYMILYTGKLEKKKQRFYIKDFCNIILLLISYKATLYYPLKKAGIFAQNAQSYLSMSILYTDIL